MLTDIRTLADHFLIALPNINSTKNLYAHLYYWFYVPIRLSRDNIQISNFEEDKIVSMWICFYAVIKLIFIHPTTNFYSTSTPKILLRILTSDSMHLIGHYVSWFKFQILKNMRSSWCFLLTRSIRMYKTLSHSTQNYEFLFFSKRYSQQILNRAQKYQEFNGENLFWIRCFVEKLSWKNGRD